MSFLTENSEGDEIIHYYW